MYGWETLVLLKHLLEQGLSKAAIAERLGVSRRVERFSSLVLRWRSRSETLRLTVASGTPKRRAAAERLPASTAATKSDMALRRSITSSRKWKE